MATVKRFEDLEVWKMARELAKEVGTILKQDGLRINYRLVHQIESAAGSIMDNIAEGFERGSRLEFIQFIGFAKGSCGELKSQLYRLYDWKFIGEELCNRLITQTNFIGGKLQRLLEYLRQSEIEGSRKKRKH